MTPDGKEPDKAPRPFKPERWSALAEHFSGGILITDSDGRVLWANPGFLKLTEYSLPELLGKKPGHLLQGTGSDPAIVTRIQQYIANAESFEAELLNYTKSGKPYTVYLKVDPVFDADGSLQYFIGFQTDVTARRKQAELMESILKSAHHAIVTLSLEGRILSFNPGAERLLGYSESDALDGLDPLVFHDKDQLGARAEFLSRHLGQTVDPDLNLFYTIADQDLSSMFEEWTYIRKNGDQIYAELALTLLRDAAGTATGYLAIVKDRTELHDAEHELESFAGKLRKLSRLLPGAIYQFEMLPDGSFRFPYASEAIHSIYNVSPDEVKNDASPILNVIHPDDVSRVLDTINESAATLEPWVLEYRVQHRDGQIRWLYGYANPERLDNNSTLWHGFITDITDRKDSERRLTESEARLSFALEATRDGVWDWNLDTNEVFWSPRCFEMLGYEPFSFPVTFETWKSLIHPSDLNRTISYLQEYLTHSSRPLNMSFRLLHSDGDYRWISGRGKVTERNSDGTPMRMVGTHLDITDRKTKDEQLKLANKRLEDTNRQLELSIWHANELARQAESANEAKSSFIANMSHEIRTPMTSILGFANLLSERGLSDEEFRDHLRSLREAGEHLMIIVNDILDISRIESGKLEIEVVPVSPAGTIMEVFNMLKAKATMKGLEFRRDISTETPDSMSTDPGRLRQILLNLVGNAIKFTREGYIEIRSECMDNQLEISVIDTGIGITEDALLNLFQPFTQADSSTTRKYGGSGLGLAISRRLAHILGGEIIVKSKPGEGSSFTLRLPVLGPGRAGSALDNEGSPPRPTPNGLNANPSEGENDELVAPQVHVPALDGMNVLVVEDDPDIRKIVQLYLSRCNVHADTLENGKLALNRLLQLQHPYDCVLMDIQMPEMDGKTVMTELRRNGYSGPVVAMTAHALSSEVSDILGAGFDAYLPKPINRQMLHETLQQYQPDSRESRNE